jgi:L-Ala-D/L-Glu epimerase
MKLNYQLQKLDLEFVFAISRSSSSQAETILLELDTEYNDQSYQAIGEAVYSRFYGEDENSIIDFYKRINEDKILSGLDPFNVQDFEARMSSLPGNNQAAKSGLDIALWDLRGKILGLPLYRLLGLDSSRIPKTSYTIGLADLDTIKRKTLTALERGYDILKVKLGSPNDLKIIELIRELAPSEAIRVDANAAWTCDEALKLLKVLKELRVEFVEEPLRLDSSIADYERLKAESPLALMADESCHTSKDLVYCSKYFHSINLKHTKTGGLTEALRMIHTARALGLKIMLGCFTESSVSITAFAHLGPLVDYLDLDGSLLLAKDPFQGVEFHANKLILPTHPGLGVRKSKHDE